MKKIARIFEDEGKYYFCDDTLEYLDARGTNYPTKADAQKAAAESGYTHMVGSGTYHKSKIQIIPKKFRK